MSEHRSNYGAAIAIAVIGLVGTIGAALVGNWDKIFPPTPPVADHPHPVQQPNNTQPPELKPTTVLRSEQDKVVGYKWISEGSGLIVFEVDYTYDPAHERQMYVRVIIYSEAEPAEPGQKPRRRRIADGLSEPLALRAGTVRVDARKLLGQPARSSFIEVTLMEETVPINVKQFSYRRRWGPA